MTENLTLKLLRLDAPFFSDLEAFDASKLSADVVDGLVGLLQSGEQIFTLELDRAPAPTANECVVRLDPSDRLRRLMTAAGARNTDLGTFEHPTLLS